MIHMNGFNNDSIKLDFMNLCEMFGRCGLCNRRNYLSPPLTQEKLCANSKMHWNLGVNETNVCYMIKVSMTQEDTGNLRSQYGKPVFSSWSWRRSPEIRGSKPNSK